VTTFLEAIREGFGNDQEADDTLRDLAEHGADAGWPGLTYYTDTSALYRAHADEIWDALYEDAQDMGEPHPLALVATLGGAENVANDYQLENLLVWYMAERVARDFADR
jgi:hypothetical protein